MVQARRAWVKTWDPNTRIRGGAPWSSVGLHAGLCLEARARGDHRADGSSRIVIPRAGTWSDGVRDVVGGDRREVREALPWLVQSGDVILIEITPTGEVVIANASARTPATSSRALSLPRFGAEQRTDASTERVQAHRAGMTVDEFRRSRERVSESNETRFTSVSATDRNGDGTLLEEKREKEDQNTPPVELTGDRARDGVQGGGIKFEDRDRAAQADCDQQRRAEAAARRAPGEPSRFAIALPPRKAAGGAA